MLAAALTAALTVHAAAPDKRRTEADLKAVAERIERVRQQVQRDAVERDRLNKDLKAAELSVATTRGELLRLRDQRQARNNERERLESERKERESQRDRTRQDLQAQLRSAYFMGHNEPLKLLLNQRSPAQFGRNLTYYGYFGRLRATQINAITDNIATIDELRSKIDEEDVKLKELELARTQRLGELESARKQRGRVLASLDTETRGRTASLKRLEQQQSQLERLLKDLSRALESEPVDPNDVFAKLRGKLSWPVAGKVVADFGDTRAGAVKWDGVMIAADRGTPVKAVHDGRVVYADWLPGRGLLIIVDHGNGYLSLYAHNEQLFKQNGAGVAAGETIASAGDSGGRKESGLYFEIRRGGKPVNPRPWFKSSSPPAG
jgi:murein hydrolase activator